MSTIGGLLLPSFKPYDLGGTLEQANRIAGGVTNNQTALLQLADVKAKQQAEQEFLLAIKNDPALAQQLLGGSTIAGLPTTGGPPGGMPGTGPPPGPITQSPMGGGPAQQIPAYPDASQFATQGTPGAQNPRGFAPEGAPPQSVIASLGPQGGMPGQPQGQPPQNPLLAMAQRDPRAAMMLQQQMQAQQDRQWKMQEQRLDWGVKTAEYVARMIGNVKDQGGLDEAREQIRQVHPQAAAQLPQFYSKEAIETLQQKGIAVANLAAWHKDEATARRTDFMTQRLPATMQRMTDFITGGTPQVPTGEAPAPTTTAAPATGRPAGGGPPPESDPRVAQLEARIKKGQALVLEVANQPGMEGQAALLNQQVNDLQKERDRLEERSTEVPRAVARETALQPLKLAQQRAGAVVQLEAKMNEPIGAENAIKMDLPPQTKWKDVPKDTKVLDRPGEGVATKLGEYKASHEGITRVIGMLDKPGATSIVGTLFSEPDASFRRRAGEWISSVTPQERKFAAAMVAEIASIRHALAGSAVSPEEAAFVKDMMPKTSDPDVGTVRAKLEVLQEWVATKHEGMRDQLEQMRFRAPKALPRSVAAQPPAGLTPDQQRLLDKHTTR